VIHLNLYPHSLSLQSPLQVLPFLLTTLKISALNGKCAIVRDTFLTFIYEIVNERKFNILLARIVRI